MIKSVKPDNLRMVKPENILVRQVWRILLRIDNDTRHHVLGRKPPQFKASTGIRQMLH